MIKWVYSYLGNNHNNMMSEGRTTPRPLYRHTVSLRKITWLINGSIYFIFIYTLSPNLFTSPEIHPEHIETYKLLSFRAAFKND